MIEANRWETVGKLSFSVIVAAVSAYFEIIALPVVLLTGVMIADYVTGMTEAWMKSQLSSRIGLKGIVKKLSYLMLVVAAVVVDWLIYSTCSAMGVEFSSGIFGLTVTVWLIINELISILENLSGIGVPMPEFFHKAIIKLRNNVENSESEE